eukprot:1141660-Pelagomonas_calceolata.AAC.7
MRRAGQVKPDSPACTVEMNMMRCRLLNIIVLEVAETAVCVCARAAYSSGLPARGRNGVECKP